MDNKELLKGRFFCCGITGLIPASRSMEVNINA